MDEQHVHRVLALGHSALLDRMTGCLAGAGYAVVHLANPTAARCMLELGDIDAVVADGNATGLAGLLSADASDRPWLLLGQPAEGPLPEGRATALAADASGSHLCRELSRHLSRPRSRAAGSARGR